MVSLRLVLLSCLLSLGALWQAYGQSSLPEKESWPLVSLGVPRLHASFPYEPSREDRSVFSDGNLIRASLYTLYVRSLDWKFEVMVIPKGQMPKSKEAAAWVETETNRNILTSGAGVLSRRSCKDPILGNCVTYDLLTPDGLIIKGRTGVYESYVITLLSSGKYPTFNEVLAEHFISSLVLPRSGVPLAPSPQTPVSINVMPQESWVNVPGETFEISFPSTPQERTLLLRGDNFDMPVQSWQLARKRDNVVLHISRHAPVVDIAVAKSYLEHAMNGTLNRQKGKMLMQYWLEAETYTGLEFVFSSNDDIFKCRYVLSGGYLYQLLAKGERSVVLGPAGIRFFDSFALIGE